MPEETNNTGKAKSQGGISKARVLATAADLFRRKGYSQSTMRELASLLGLKKASLYHYVERKDDLLSDICMESLRRIDSEVAKAAEGASTANRVSRVIHAHVRSALVDRDLHTVMLIELRALSPTRHGEVVKRRDMYEERIRGIIRMGQEDGLLRSDVKTEYLTLALLNLLNWTIFWYQPSGPLSPEELGDLLATQFLDGARLVSVSSDSSEPSLASSLSSTLLP